MNLVSLDDYNQMKSWVGSIYQKTKGSSPSIPSVTQDSVVLASQVNTLQNLLNTAYDSYVDLNCTHNATVKTSLYSGYNYTYGSGSGATTTGNGTYKTSYYSECSSQGCAKD